MLLFFSLVNIRVIFFTFLRHLDNVTSIGFVSISYKYSSINGQCFLPLSRIALTSQHRIWVMCTRDLQMSVMRWSRAQYACMGAASTATRCPYTERCQIAWAHIYERIRCTHGRVIAIPMRITFCTPGLYTGFSLTFRSPCTKLLSSHPFG